MRRASAVILLLTLGSMSTLRAVIWQSNEWAVVSSVTGAVGYDTNLYLTKENEEDGFISADPSITLRRWGGATKLDIGASLTAMEFVNGRSDAQLDGGVQVNYAYPFVSGSLPRYTGLAQWKHATIADSYVGRRVTVQTLRAGGSARLYSSGKLGANAEAMYDRNDYSEDGLNENQRGSISVGLAYSMSPALELQVNSVSSFGESRPSNGGTAVIRNWEQGVTFRAIGDLSAKLSSSAYVGVTSARYRGAFRDSDVLPLAGGDITYEATPNRTFRLGLDFGSDFSSEGESLQTRRVVLSVEQRMLSFWRLGLKIAPAQSERRRGDGEKSTDDYIGFGGTAAYDFSEAVSIDLSYDFARQDSDRRIGSYERHLFNVRSTFRF